jgi:uncharacterized protein (DUF934 family)
MTVETATPETRLWTPDGFREDEWHHAASVDDIGGNGRFILPLAAFLSLDGDRRAALRGRIGVLLMPGEPIDKIVPLLDDIALVALSFPAFNDGRSFSKAELLRSRHAFTAPIRAVGQVLVDQLPHMLRLGFDQFDIANAVLLARLEQGRVGGLDLYYQPTASAQEHGPTRGAAYSWRRAKAG